MTESTQEARTRHSKIFPKRAMTPEELARQEALDEIFHQRCREIFERVRPELIDKYYGWYIAVEPDSGEYLIDKDNIEAHKKALAKYPNADHCVFCLNESGATGRI
ncbi:hypothetical protein NIES4071_58920 [Calothrix sp. NIES-4071]|nr:hypothetical protein NIES4071_58920 [Calothrix sp. NIES-4071]BAZ60199.1 hypothetical protein NIES4105_58870 [Calothrix sp. NIES-4105]